jgi:hypothetical protein
MMTRKADNRSRVQLPDVKPGTVFEITTDGSGRFNLVEVSPKEPKDVPVVNPTRRKDGSYKWPVKLSREEIVAAIRADRDSR